MPGRSLATVALALCWALSLAAGAVWISWSQHAGWLDRLDRAARERWLYGPGERYEAIAEAYSQDADAAAAVRKLSDLYEELAPVQKLDALGPLKRVVLAQLVRIHGERAELTAARAWAKAWVEFDAYDLDARSELAGLLMLDRPSRIEGEALFAELRARFPESLNLAAYEATALARLGELDRAILRLLPNIADAGNPLMEIIGGAPVVSWFVVPFDPAGRAVPSYWAWLESEAIGVSRPYEGYERFLVIESRDPVKSIRIDFPDHLPLRMTLPIVTPLADDTVSGPVAGFGWRATADDLDLNGLQVRQNHLHKPLNHSGALHVTLPEPVTGRIRLDMEVRVAPPIILAQLMAPAVQDELQEQLGSRAAEVARALATMTRRLGPR